jgi:HK97 family phage prohead protease
MTAAVVDLEAPRDDLIRMARGSTLETRAEGDGRLLFGYAAMFNKDTTINSWEGNFIERIAPGAFKRSLRNSGDIQVLFNHGMDPSIGDKPLGSYSVLREDSEGLYAEVPLSPTSYNEDLAALITDKALRGMSFRFSVVRDTWEQPSEKSSKLPIRTLQEVRLFEFGPVTFPAYAATTVGVRSREDFGSWRSLPQEKRDAIYHILGTSPSGPATSTPDGEPADATHGDDSATRHSLRPLHVLSAEIGHIQTGVWR